MNPLKANDAPPTVAESPACRDRGRLRNTLFWGVVLLVLASRLPFIHVGYGTDADAWRLADAARQIAETGRYVASRLPGHPLQEGVCALLSSAGPIALNACTALLSAVAIACFMKTLRALGSNDELLAGLALAVTPVVYINSTNSMDYVWALAFILASHHAVLIRKPVLAGCLLGLAAGCRITSGAMLLPLAVLAYSRHRWCENPFSHPLTRESLLARLPAGRRHSPPDGLPLERSGSDERPLRTLVGLCLATVLVSAAAYTPGFIEYGWDFLTFRAPPVYPPLITVISRATLHVWGCIGGVAIVTGLGVAQASRLGVHRRDGGATETGLTSAGAGATSIPRGTGNTPIYAAALAIAVYFFAFLLLPLDEGYLIPAVPFVILLLARILDRRVFRLVCLAICFSPFLCSLGRAASAPAWTYSGRALRFNLGAQQLVLDVLRGPILREHAERVGGAAFMDRVLERGRTLPEDSVVVVGHWLPQIKVMLGPASSESRRYVYLLDEDQLRQYGAAGVEVWFLPEIAAFNREVHGLDLERAGARPLHILQ